MVILGVWVFLMTEVPLYEASACAIYLYLLIDLIIYPSSYLTISFPSIYPLSWQNYPKSR